MITLRRIFAALTFSISSVAMFAAVGTLNINGVDQQVDTIVPKHLVGPGTEYAFYHLPNRPLTIHVLEIDLTNEYVQMEVCDGGQKSVATETPSNMYKRNDSPGHDMIAAYNGDFFHTSSTDATATGMSRMGLISNGECILNPVGYPMFVLSDDKVAYTELLYFNATLSTATSSTRIHTLNSHALEFDAADDSERMILYTHAYGTLTNATTGGTKVIIAPKEGEFSFASNSTIGCIVESIDDNTGATTIPAGKAVLYGTGANATFLQGLTVGEECTITISNSMPAQASVTGIKEALGGSGHFIIQDGEVVISGNPDIHPRTFMGISQDRKRVYSVVVDGRWEGSAGVSLDDEGRILKWLGAWDGINLDGGGSSGMVVNGEYKNHASDGSERAVGNGMLVFSSAPADDNVSQIAFEARQYNVPITARFRPAIYGYNQYGVLKSKDLENVKLTCDPQLGTINENNEFTASEEVTSGYIYAEYNGITTKQLVNTIHSPLSLVYESYIVDNRAFYPIHMNAAIGNFIYDVDAASVNWAIDDASLCTISDGKVKGLQTGVATLTGASSNFNGNVTINVEIPESNTKSIFPAFNADSWTITQTGGTGIAISESGEGVKLNYTGNGSSRGANISITPSTLTTYGLPYGFSMEINPGNATVKSIQISMRNNNGELLTQTITSTQLTKNENNILTTTLPTSWSEDNTNYPISIIGLVFSMGASAKNTDFEIQISKLHQLYNDPSGIENITKERSEAVKIYPNPVISSSPIIIEADASATVNIYTLGGSVIKKAVLDGTGAVSTAGLPAGMYVVEVTTDNNTSVAKLIVK